MSLQSAISWLEHKNRKLNEADLAELFHWIQFEELPMLVHRNNMRWAVSLDMREMRYSVEACFILKDGFTDWQYAVRWARIQFAPGDDTLNIELIEGIFTRG